MIEVPVGASTSFVTVKPCVLVSPAASCAVAVAALGSVVAVLSQLYVVEYGNNRVQKFTPEGRSLGCWGGPGRGPGRLSSPWALAVDSRGRVHVLDSENDRVQRIAF